MRTTILALGAALAAAAISSPAVAEGFEGGHSGCGFSVAQLQTAMAKLGPVAPAPQTAEAPQPIVSVEQIVSMAVKGQFKLPQQDSDDES